MPLFFKFKKALELKVFIRKTCDLRYNMLYKNKNISEHSEEHF